MVPSVSFSGQTRPLTINDCCVENGRYNPNSDNQALKQLQANEFFFCYGSNPPDEQPKKGFLKWYIAGNTDPLSAELSHAEQRLKRALSLNADQRSFIERYRPWAELRTTMASQADSNFPPTPKAITRKPLSPLTWRLTSRLGNLAKKISSAITVPFIRRNKS